MSKEIGTVVSTFEGPSPSSIDFVVSTDVLHRGQYVQMEYSEGIMVALVNDVVKTNRYFERAESVKEFEKNGRALFEQFPVHEWEYLLAKTRPLGVYQEGKIKRPTFPPSPGTKVKIAEKEVLKKFLDFDEEKGLEVGEVEYHNLPAKLNLNRLMQKHLAILAMSGAGKCLNYDSKIFLENHEQKQIGEIVDFVLSKNKKIEEGVEFWEEDLGIKTYSLDDGKIKPSKILGYYRRKAPEEILQIKTRTGNLLEVTPEHFVPVFNGKIEWKKAEELSENDYLIRPRIEWEGKETAIDFTESVKGIKNLQIFQGFAKQRHSKFKIKLRQVIDEDMAKLFAYFLSEGHNTCFRSRLIFSNCDTKIQNEFSRILGTKFGLKARSRKNELLFDCLLLAHSLQKHGFTKSSWTKFVPKEILQSKKEILQSFLAAFIDCDGHINKKKPEIEITLASKKLSEGIEEIISKLGITSIKKTKKYKEKEYQRIFISGSKEIKKLEGLNLKIEYKKKALEKWTKTKSNTNIDIVPNLQEHFKEILILLKMFQPQSESSGINNYLYRRDNPSRENLEILIKLFEKRALEVENAIKQATELYESIPKIEEQNALEIVENAYAAGINFKQIAMNSGISSTTARRIVRGITNPKHSAFLLAKNALKIQNKNFEEFEEIEKFNANNTLHEIKNLCKVLNYSTEKLCLKNRFYKAFLYSHSNNRGTAEHSKTIALSKSLAEIAEKQKQDLLQANAKVAVLKQAMEMNAFFDKVKKIEKIKPKSEFVYDLSVENSNFTANGILIHNSYLVSVLLEELLDRKKENGRIACVLLDSHGEYTGFAETEKEKKDYSSKTRVLKSRQIKIGVPKLSVGILSTIIPSLSPIQKRELARIMQDLQQEMRSGLGPFDLSAVRKALMDDESIVEGTKKALVSWIAELEELRLFDETDSFSLNDLVKPGTLTIIDLSDEINLKRKQIISSYFAKKLFDERRKKSIPPFSLFVEEAHQYCPEGTSFEHAIAKGIMETIAREGRKFGASLVLVSQRPKRLSTTALSQCNTFIILRITNPYDLKHIGESAEAIDSKSQDMISGMKVGEALIVGEAVNYPVFVKIRKRKSSDSKHEIGLEKAALNFEEKKEQETKETEEYL